MNHPEDQLHIAVATFLRLALDADDGMWFHPPNGGARSKREGGRFKQMGVLPGIPDLVFLLPDGRTGFIELKAPAGRFQASQRIIHADLQRLGHRVAVCRSVEEVETTLRAWGVPLSASVRGRAA